MRTCYNTESMSGIRKSSQSGVVSILVTMIMMLVISLIVVGVAQVTRRNTRSGLDRQLSTQAYYAAESGVNDARSYLYQNPGTSLNTTGCTDFIKTASLHTKSQLSVANNVSYTCLLVNTSPTELSKAPVDLGTSVVWRLQDANNRPIRSLTFNWGSAQGYNGSNKGCNNTSGQLPSAPSWNCKYGLLRIDLVQLPTSGAVNSVSNLKGTNAKTIFVLPGTADNIPGLVYGGSTQSSYMGTAKCVSGDGCTATLHPSGGSSRYYARISMVYQSAAYLSVVGKVVPGGDAISFAGAQAVIDSTGKAQDELRRIQVRVPLTGDANFPQYALQSTGEICKLISISQTGDGQPTFSDPCPFTTTPPKLPGNNGNNFPPPGKDNSGVIKPGTRLNANMVVYSSNKLYFLAMQNDGNLVLYKTGSGAVGTTALWSSGTWGHSGAYAIFQKDGNLVVYPQFAGGALWNSNTPNQGAKKLIVQTDGNMVIYSATSALWATNTTQ